MIELLADVDGDRPPEGVPTDVQPTRQRRDGGVVGAKHARRPHHRPDRQSRPSRSERRRVGELMNPPPPPLRDDPATRATDRTHRSLDRQDDHLSTSIDSGHMEPIDREHGAGRRARSAPRNRVRHVEVFPLERVGTPIVEDLDPYPPTDAPATLTPAS